MALEEYRRKRRFQATPEPPPKLEQSPQHRFVVQKHRASHLHFDFRLEMEGVLKSWAVPKGPSLDPADKRLAMMVEDHPVSYIDFEGIIPPGNYGAGTVQVWDIGTWTPLGNASEMLAKGDLKFEVKGKKLKGSFVLARMRSRRPGSKGNEWLLIKHRDPHVVPSYDANAPKYDRSALTRRSLGQIAGDAGSAEWQSNRPAATKESWLADTLRKVAKKRTTENTEEHRGNTKKKSTAKAAKTLSPRKMKKKSSVPSVSSVVNQELSSLKGAQKRPMPSRIQPMLATLVDAPFNDNDWLFEIKWDGYRALAFLDRGGLRLVSRNQNDLTAEFPEIAEVGAQIHARQAIVDGEIVALDDQGRPSFSLMQQRTGFTQAGRRVAPRQTGSPIVYYAFDLLYLDGYDLMRVDLEERKELLKSIVDPSDILRYSEHFIGRGTDLYDAAKQRGLEGIVGKRRRSCYLQKRSREWLKMKITQRMECVIGGYTDPRGGREHFGSIVLGAYDDQGRLVHVGNAGSGFNEQSHADMWRRLEKLRIDKSPFHGKVEATRGTHWAKPELVAEIKFTEWTHSTELGGLKMRAPVFQGLRFDKPPEECRLERALPAREEARKAEHGEAA